MRKNEYRKPPFELDRSRYGDLAVQIASGLRQAIETGYYRAGEILPPGRDLATLLGVSKGIAEQALARVREEGLISPRPRVGSVVCAKDRPLWKGHVVIVVPPGLGNPFANFVYAVVRDRLTAAGYLTTPVPVGETSPGKFDDFALLDTVLRQQTDLVVQIQGLDNIARHLAKAKVPFVRLATTDTRPPNCVGILRYDKDLAIPDFAAHCREAKVRSVTQISLVRRADASAILEEAGIKVSTINAPKDMGFGTRCELAEWSRDIVVRTLAAKGKACLPDLFYFNDDFLATGALLALLAAGVRIPEDVRVVTWANRDYAPIFLKSLTRMEMDNAAIGEKLAECVMEYLKGGTFPEGVVVGPRYVRGETF